MSMDGDSTRFAYRPGQPEDDDGRYAHAGEAQRLIGLANRVGHEDEQLAAGMLDAAAVHGVIAIAWELRGIREALEALAGGAEGP
jgi:hypothetical protein